MLTRATDDIIEQLIEATYGDPADVRQRHVFAHALHGLVRLAKCEQLLAIRSDVERATSHHAGHSSRQQARALLHKIGMELARDGGGGVPRGQHVDGPAPDTPDTLHGDLEDR
ncbi:hypothetical protein H3H36_07830 [Duganella sp. FT3S]|uniref:Uncharacterized protein n=1 Tax=Rugamonas fusca TaxID=2758568 RepID=A0A7W2EG08_9BURK|nr:hypothetical protein [Rugamonas fusca]MBA5605265.1 hypothetical protein [Rugamonas fusca]